MWPDRAGGRGAGCPGNAVSWGCINLLWQGAGQLCREEPAPPGQCWRAHWDMCAGREAQTVQRMGSGGGLSRVAGMPALAWCC